MKKTFLILMAALPLLFVSCGPDNPENPDTPDDPGKTDSGQTTPDKSGAYGIKAVDLGLSVEWASRNIGAENDTEAGDYFAWGETKKKDVFKWETYKYGATADNLTKYNATDGLKVLQPADDAARQILGGKWRTPTTDEWLELRKVCTWKWVSSNNVYGAEGTVGDFKIFLPAGGGITGASLLDYGNYGFYLTANLVADDISSMWSFYVTDMSVNSMDFPRGRYGFMVRAVRDK